MHGNYIHYSLNHKVLSYVVDCSTMDYLVSDAYIYIYIYYDIKYNASHTYI